MKSECVSVTHEVRRSLGRSGASHEALVKARVREGRGWAMDAVVWRGVVQRQALTHLPDLLEARRHPCFTLAHCTAARAPATNERGVRQQRPVRVAACSKARLLYNHSQALAGVGQSRGSRRDLPSFPAMRAISSLYTHSPSRLAPESKQR